MYIEGEKRVEKQNQKKMKNGREEENETRVEYED